MPTMMKKSKFRLSRRIVPATPTKADSTVTATNSAQSDIAPTIEDFRFLDLPGEQRNEICRYLFDDITTPNKEFQVWADQVPGYDGKLAAYGALVRTCKHVFQEVSTIWTREYLPNLTLYFDDIRDFFRLCGPREPDAPKVTIASGLKNTPVKFLLATRTDVRTVFIGPAYDLMEFMVGKSFVRNVVLYHAFDYLDPFFSATFPVGPNGAPMENACEFTMVVVDEDLEYRMVRHPRVPTYPRLKTFTRRLSHDVYTKQATGTIEGHIRDLTWDGWHEQQSLHERFLRWDPPVEPAQSPWDTFSWCLTGWAGTKVYADHPPLSAHDERMGFKFWATVVSKHGGSRRKCAAVEDEEDPLR